MINRFKNAIAKVPEVTAYKLIETRNKTSELYYVLDRLETTRGTDTVSYSATIYSDKEELRGSANFAIYSYMSEEELVEKIKEQVYAASFALDPYYDIPEKEDADIKESHSSLKSGELKDHLEEIVNAVFKADAYSNGYLAATEFFLYETTTRIVNSKGVDLTSTGYACKIELIPSWDDKDNEVEIYHMMELETIDAEKISKDVDELLLLAKARAEATTLKVDTPMKVILQDDEVSQVFTYYATHLNYAGEYTKSNLFKVGDSVQGDEVKGDKLNMEMVPYYEGAMNSRAFDNDGVVLKPIKLIEDGVAKAMFGNYRFGYYLKEKRPTGTYPVMVVKEGTRSFAEMKDEPYIRCVRFSGMQLDPHSGYIGGEVRLAFYYDGEKEIPVTGFSIAGNMHELKGDFVYSKETQTISKFHGPKYLEIKGMNIL